MDEQAKRIWGQVTENQAKLRDCERHEFARVLGSYRYKCKNCGGEVDGTAAHYYEEGLKHGKAELEAEYKNRKKTFVISAFPGCGKSYCYGAYQDKFTMLDSDSSKFSWILDKNGESTGERNPDFPHNYIEHIKQNIGKADIIFVSSHDTVRTALKEAGIKTIMISPARDMKDIWLDRLEKRGNDEKFIGFISKNWDKFLEAIESEDNNNIVLRLSLDKAMPYITYDILDALVTRCHNLSN